MMGGGVRGAARGGAPAPKALAGPAAGADERDASQGDAGRRDAPDSHGVPPLVAVRDLSVAFETELGVVEAVRGVSFEVRSGEIVAIVGESGSGKSATALSLIGLTREGGASLRGLVAFDGVDVLSAPQKQLRGLRGAQMSIVFQDPLSSLNPVHRVGDQIVEQLRAHERLSRSEAKGRAIDALRRAGMDNPERRMSAYPYELSGGQRQRAMIALALSCNPRLLIADEPTSALDVTVQAEILDELARLRKQTGTAIVLVSHDLAVVSGIADRVLVMHDGAIVEAGARREIFERPSHPRTQALLEAAEAVYGGAAVHAHEVRAHESARPRRARTAVPGDAQLPADDGDAPARRPLLSLEGVCASYAQRRSWGHRSRPAGHDGAAAPPRRDRDAANLALDGVSLDVLEGEMLGIVGASGCGKTTLVRCAARLLHVSAGTIAFEGQEITRARRRVLRPVRHGMQVVFQDPDASLNPRKRVEQILAVPLRMRGVSRGALEGEVAALLAEVGLTPAHAHRFPHELSGGQRQRIGIARALALQPRLLLLDEPVSSLDVTVRMQIVQLLEGLAQRRGLSCLFVAHDIALLRSVCDRIAVMRAGRIVEIGDAEQVCAAPQHPETKALLAAVPALRRGGPAAPRPLAAAQLRSPRADAA